MKTLRLLPLLVLVVPEAFGMFAKVSSSRTTAFTADVIYTRDEGTWTERIVVPEATTIQWETPAASVRFVGVSQVGTAWNAGPLGSAAGHPGQCVHFALSSAGVVGSVALGGVDRGESTSAVVDWSGSLPQEAEVFLYGFFFGVTLELFGLMLRVVRGIRGGTGME